MVRGFATVEVPGAELVLPGQWADLNGRGGESSGEFRLLRAVLEQAIADYLKEPVTRRDEALYQDAWRWICDRGASAIFSFESVCAAFGIDAGAMRAELPRAKALGLSFDHWRKNFSAGGGETARGRSVEPLAPNGNSPLRARTGSD
jgi:hypothetical protein